MKNSFLILFALSLLFNYSCANEDDQIKPVTEDPENQDPNNPLNLTLDEVIEIFSGGNNDKIWKISSAVVSNTNGVDQLDITNLFNVKDDEFRFVSSNQTIDMRHKRGFYINSLGTDMDSFKSDKNVSSIQASLMTIQEPTISFEGLQGLYTFSLLENNSIIKCNITNESYLLELELAEKTLNDFLPAANSISNPIELFQFQTGIFRVGFKHSQANESLYITNRNDLEVFGQLAFKIDLQNGLTEELSFTQQDFATKNIEFIEDQVVSIGGSKFELFDFNFENPIITDEVPGNAIVSNGSASLDDTAYLFGGLVNGAIDVLSTWNINQADYTDITTLPFELDDLDGEIIDQKLYMFGGREIGNPQNQGSNIVYIYDLDLDQTTQIVIPVTLRETYTSIVEQLIYVGGLQPVDEDADGNYELSPFIGVFNTTNNEFTSLDIDLGNVLDNKRLVHFQAKDEKGYFITSENLGAPNGFINRVYEADLN